MFLIAKILIRSASVLHFSILKPSIRLPKEYCKAEQHVLWLYVVCVVVALLRVGVGLGVLLFFVRLGICRVCLISAGDGRSFGVRVRIMHHSVKEAFTVL